MLSNCNKLISFLLLCTHCTTTYTYNLCSAYNNNVILRYAITPQLGSISSTCTSVDTALPLPVPLLHSYLARAAHALHCSPALACTAARRTLALTSSLTSSTTSAVASARIQAALVLGAIKRPCDAPTAAVWLARLRSATAAATAAVTLRDWQLVMQCAWRAYQVCISTYQFHTAIQDCKT
jgi:hypothetical protein